jgi:hypothetical protein
MSSPSHIPQKGKGRRTKIISDDWTLDQLFAFNAGETIAEWEETEVQRDARITAELDSKKIAFRQEVSKLLNLQSNVLNININDMDVRFMSYDIDTGAPEPTILRWDTTLKYIPLISAGGRSLGAPRFDGDFSVPEVGWKIPACNLKAVKNDLLRMKRQGDDISSQDTGLITSSKHSNSSNGNAKTTEQQNITSKRTATQAAFETPPPRKRRNVEIAPSPFTLRSTVKKSATAATAPVQTTSSPSTALAMDMVATTRLATAAPSQPIRKSRIIILKLRQHHQHRIRVFLAATAKFLMTASKFPTVIRDERTLVARWNAVPDHLESDWAVAKREILKTPGV